MAGWTKADYDNAYSIRVERYFGGKDPGRPEVRVNYHRWGMGPILADRWAKFVPILGLGPSDLICVAGCGFGWGVEALVAETGATAVGVDISDYVAAEITNTEEAELRANIAATGLDPDSGRGAELLAILNDGQPRGNIVFLQSDMSSQNERQLIRAALGGNWPSVVIFEDIFDDTWTDQDILNARNAGNGFGGAQRLIAVYTPTDARSAADVQTIMLGAEVITTDGLVYLP